MLISKTEYFGGLRKIYYESLGRALEALSPEGLELLEYTQRGEQAQLTEKIQGYDKETMKRVGIDIALFKQASEQLKQTMQAYRRELLEKYGEEALVHLKQGDFNAEVFHYMQAHPDYAYPDFVRAFLLNFLRGFLAPGPSSDED